MKKLEVKVALFSLLALILASCQSDPQTVEVTVEVEKEITREVEVEVTRLVEVAGEALIVRETEVVEVTPTPETVEIPQGGEVVESTIADILTLNPILGADAASASVYNRLFLSLVRLDASTGRMVGQIADSWDVSADGLTYTFNLRDDIVWSDGTPLTANDVAFTYDAINSEAVASPLRAGFHTVESWEALDAATLELRLQTVDCTLLPNLGIGILPAHVYDGDLTAIAESPETLAPTVVSGPFLFEAYVPNDYVLLTANPDYYLGRPNIDTWRLNVYEDQSAAIAAFLAGETTWTTVSPEFVSVVEAEIARGRPMQIERYFDNSYTFLGFNLANPENPQNGWDDLDGDGQYSDGEPPLVQDPHPILGDPLVRQAIALSIDYTGLINRALAGQGGPIAANVWPSIDWAYSADLLPYAQDFEAAEALLDEAGWTRPNDDVVRTRAGETLTLQLTTNSGNEAHEMMALLLKESLESVGFEVEILYQEFGLVVRELLGQTYDMVLMKFGDGPPEPDDASQFSFKNDAVNAGFNFASFYDAEFEANLDGGKAVVGCAETERAPFYLENQTIFHEKLPYVVLHVPLESVVWHDSLQNLGPNAWDSRHNIESWYLTPSE